MIGPPDLPGGEISDTGEPVVEIGDTELTPLPGGQVQDPEDRLSFAPQSKRLFVQELARASLAFSFVILLAAVIVFGFIEINTKSWSNAKDYLEILVPAISALLGSATGFYFGTRR